MNSFQNRIVAHRGDQTHHPENTLGAFQAAVNAGARWLEGDIQLSKDEVPLFMHDADICRMCGKEGMVSKLHYAELSERCAELPLLSLVDFVSWFAALPSAPNFFLEIKQECLEQMSADLVIEVVSGIVAAFKSRIVLISSSPSLIEAAQKAGFVTGWVAEGVTNFVRVPEYVFLDVTDMQALEQWRASGTKIAVYTCNDAAEAERLLNLGIDMVETDYFCRVAGSL